MSAPDPFLTLPSCAAETGSDPKAGYHDKRKAIPLSACFRHLSVI
jgi:hypothetical protein